MSKNSTTVSFVAEVAGDVNRLMHSHEDGNMLILPLRDSILFPGTVNPITIGRKSSLKAVKHAERGERILGVFCKRVWLLFTSFVTPNVYGGAGITLGTSAAQQPYANIWSLGGTYVPTVPEVLVALGVISLGVLIFLVLSEKLLAKKEA